MTELFVAQIQNAETGDMEILDSQYFTSLVEAKSAIWDEMQEGQDAVPDGEFGEWDNDPELGGITMLWYLGGAQIITRIETLTCGDR